MRRRLPKPAALAPALQRLGLASPPPFVGRAGELERLAEAMADTAVVVVVGGIGAGKTRLAREVIARRQPGGAAAYLRCAPGDRPEALRARAERVLGLVPGGLYRAMRDHSHLLVLDDLHRAGAGGAASAFHDLLSGPGVGRLVLFDREVPALPRGAPSRFDLALEGLDPTAARELWAHLEESYGPTPADACDRALHHTRGLPLALRREYAIASAGADAWSIERLAGDVRRALEVVAILAEPVAPAGVAALLPGIEVEPALIELVSRQLIDPLDSGRFSIHDAVRDQVLQALAPDTRSSLERAAAALVLRGARDDGAFALPDPIDRLRLAVHHLTAAEDGAAARALLLARAPALVERAAAGEVAGIIESLGGAAAGGAELRSLASSIAARRGEVALALEGGGPADPVLHAELLARSGAVAEAAGALEALLASADADQAARAAARLCEIEIDRAQPARARAALDGAFRPGLGDEARADLLAALGALEECAGEAASARAAYSRALAAAGTSPLAVARIEVRRGMGLVASGRRREAAAVLGEAERAATVAGALGVADEVRGARALCRAAGGDLAGAAERIEELVRALRGRGDELAALRAELDLAGVMERRGELRAAAELAIAGRDAAAALGLFALADRAAAILALVDAGAWRSSLASVSRFPEDAAERHAIALTAARGENRTALGLARAAVAVAERSGHGADLADALAWCARLELAAGDRLAAELAASRAAREATSSGATWARAAALLVLAAVVRDAGDLVAASTYARDAAQVAQAAGLPVERLIAERALAAIAGDGPELSGGAATLGAAARAAADRALADLGLTALRPFRVIAADGRESRVSAACPERLQMADRDLVVDGVREAIVRRGVLVADLRRRSLLKRLLFLFAARPGYTFSKEEIVQTVWQVDYHPLRHDAALFTNIMRIRRLLGQDGPDLIRVSEDGYRFSPTADFLFVEAAGG